MTTLSKKGPLGWRSSFFAAVSLLGLVALTSSDEFLVAVPFILMNQLFGWVGGFFASMLIWLLVGFASLGALNLIWPKIKTWAKNWESYLWLIIPLAGILALAFSTAIFLFRNDIIDRISWELVIFLVISALILLFLMAVIRIVGQKIVDWSINKVERMDPNWKTVFKPFVIVLVLVYMGPALAHPVLSLSVFNVTKRGIFWLTVLAAPLFTILWYPIYTGVWDTVTERLF